MDETYGVVNDRLEVEVEVAVLRYGLALYGDDPVLGGVCRSVPWEDLRAVWLSPQPSKHDAPDTYRAVCIAWDSGTADTADMYEPEARELYGRIMAAWREGCERAMQPWEQG